MQFGIFTVGDITPDPHSGKAPSEYRRQRNIVEMAQKAEEVGLDVFAVGQHHNPPFIASSPTTTLAYIPNTQETLNAGSFFGIAGQKRPGPQAAQVTRPQGSVGLSVTPFEELLRAD